ncbi:MAG: putative arylcarboxylate reductase component [Solirubrobacterales bacterium]|nr:putative arylcarboxylate reductase component [Solirubrobacterales bacterium]
MLQHAKSALELPYDVRPDPDEFIRAAMDWHFSSETGSPFWLQRAESLEFDPRADVRSFSDLRLFPNVADELRDVRAEDLIPKGYGARPEVVGVFESGGTTGPPKRIVMLREWWERMLAWQTAGLEAHGLTLTNRNWLVLTPSGPHMVGEMVRRQAAALGGLNFAIDMDPRWVKKLIAARRADEADAYAEHLIDQAAFGLQTQDIGVLMATPPLLERLARRDDLVELVRRKVEAIQWGGAHMDADSRHLYRTEVFPGSELVGQYGSTMILGGATERPGLSDDDPCIFDPFSPYITFRVVDPGTGHPVPYGERGQVVMNHVSKSFLLPGNLERDMATRVEPAEGQVGDSVADVTPVPRFGGEDVIEGVY